MASPDPGPTKLVTEKSHDSHGDGLFIGVGRFIGVEELVFQ